MAVIMNEPAKDGNPKRALTTTSFTRGMTAMATPILSDVLEYDPSSKTGLRWKLGRGHKKSGQEAGCISINTSGYKCWRVSVARRLMQASHVVWEICNGSPVPPGKQIDHLDGNSLNNRLENLRVIDCVLNNRNVKLSSRNVTGVVGVRFDKNRNRFVAGVVNSEGREMLKVFPVKTHGHDVAFNLAIDWRREMILARNSEGAGYTSRHGT